MHFTSALTIKEKNVSKKQDGVIVVQAFKNRTRWPIWLLFQRYSCITENPNCLNCIKVKDTSHFQNSICQQLLDITLWSEGLPLQLCNQIFWTPTNPCQLQSQFLTNILCDLGGFSFISLCHLSSMLLSLYFPRCSPQSGSNKNSPIFIID